MKILSYIILLIFCTNTLATPVDFKLVIDVKNLSLYENTDKSIQVIKRKQNPVLKNLNLSKNALKEIASARFETLKSLKLGFSDFKLIHIYKKPVSLGKNQLAYVWSGSYKDRQGKVHFVNEFISQGWTWNVYVRRKEDLKYGEKAIKAVLNI